MRKDLFFFFGLMTALFLVACSSNTETSTTNTPSTDTLNLDSPDTISLVFEDTVPIIDTLNLGTVMLDELISKQNETISQLYDRYKLALSTPDAITEEVQIEAIFSMRDSLMELIQYDVLEGSYYGELEGDMERQEKLRLELDTIGIHAVYAEGMYAGLAEGDMLVEKVSAIASPAYQAYLSFKLAYGESLGGEYPYMSLDAQMEVIKLGEKLQTEFPNAKYTPLIKESYETAVLVMTDLHAVLNTDSTAQGWITSMGVTTDMFPGATELEFYQKFVKEYSATKISKVTASILKNPSALFQLQAETDTLYLMTTDWKSTPTQARETIISHLLAGEDIPHYAEVKTAEGKKYAVIYRYYPSENQAISNQATTSIEVTITKVVRSKNGLALVEEPTE